MVLADDNRLLEINRAMLSGIGGDPPWLFMLLHSAGRRDAVLSEGLGPHARDWERLVARYARRAEARAAPAPAGEPTPEQPVALRIPPPRY